MITLINLLTILFCFPNALVNEKLSGISIANDSSAQEVCLNLYEQALYEQLNQYRQLNGLHKIELSYSLTRVAQLHSHDLATNEPHRHRNCNLHSWSKNGPWTACCYTPDHEKAACIWNKPRELTLYQGDGFEIVFFSSFPYSSPGDYAKDAFVNWSKSPGHNQIILSRHKWKELRWEAAGVGYYQGYATIWFGTLSDPDTRKVTLCQ